MLEVFNLLERVLVEEEATELRERLEAFDAAEPIPLKPESAQASPFVETLDA